MIKNNSAEDAESIDQYIASFPPHVRALLRQVRTAIRKTAPDAVEAIKYRIPTFVLRQNLVHFAAFKNHIGFYPGSTAMIAFKKEMAPYKSAKGSVQFPLDQPIPLGLIRKVVQYRVQAVSAFPTTKKSTRAKKPRRA